MESTAQLGCETWAWDLVEWVSETVPLLRKRQSTSGVLPFLFGQVQGGIHCPTRAVDLSLRLHWEGVRNATTLLKTSRLRFSKKAEHFWLLSLRSLWCSAFFICSLGVKTCSWKTFKVTLTDANGHITLNTPVLVRSLKLSSVEPSQYLDGWPLGNTGCCWHSFFSFFSFEWFELVPFPNDRWQRCWVLHRLCLVCGCSWTKNLDLPSKIWTETFQMPRHFSKQGPF